MGYEFSYDEDVEAFVFICDYGPDLLNRRQQREGIGIETGEILSSHLMLIRAEMQGRNRENKRAVALRTTIV